MTLTSAMKGLAPTVKHMLSEVVAGNFANYGGKIETLGLVSGDDTEANYVQLPLETTQWGDGFTKDDYKALVADMYNGKITVSNDCQESARSQDRSGSVLRQHQSDLNLSAQPEGQAFCLPSFL